MFFHRGREVEFVGGPFDGHRQTIRPSSYGYREVIAIPVSENVFRALVGDPQRLNAAVSSIAVYELRKRLGVYRYHFAGARTPKEFQV